MEKINKKDYRQINFLAPKKIAKLMLIQAKKEDKLMRDIMIDLMKNYLRERAEEKIASQAEKIDSSPEVEEIKQSPESWA